jgi:hypothetical protein
MSEERLGDCKLRMLAELLEFKTRRNDKLGFLLRNDRRAEFFLNSSLNEFLFFLDSQIVARVEVGNQMHTGAEAAASYVTKDVLRMQPLRDQKIKLELADLLPHSADVAAMSRGLDSLRSMSDSGTLDEILQAKGEKDAFDSSSDGGGH